MAQIKMLNRTADYFVTVKTDPLENLFSGGLYAINSYCDPNKASVAKNPNKYQIQIKKDNFECLFVRFFKRTSFYYARQ